MAAFPSTVSSSATKLTLPHSSTSLQALKAKNINFVGTNGDDTAWQCRQQYEIDGGNDGRDILYGHDGDDILREHSETYYGNRTRFRR